MPNDFTYPLTRVCLRSGQLTLPQNMLDLFPDEGTVHVVDTSSGDEFELTMRTPRHVAGLSSFFKQHNLEVNDRVTLKRLEDGRVSLTPLARPKKTDYARPDVVRSLLEKVIELGPLSEAEIRAVAPDLPAEFELKELLESDERLTLNQEGRWGLSDTERRREEPDAASEAAARPMNRPTVTSYPQDHALDNLSLNSSAQDLGDATLYTRARSALQAFGFRVQATPHAQLLAHAELGRHQYSALIHLHSEGTKPDWAKLMTRRREAGATYLALFGSHRELLRLQKPAAQSKVTLWSWQGLTRAQDLSESVPMSPFDLEPHFARDGLFEAGLTRFERTVQKRIAERGHFSLVLSRLATMRAPSVFLLDDVLTDVHFPRDQALSVLELLSQAPFHMVSKVGSGEFCLRVNVPETLTHLSDYALTLRNRLPTRRTERLRGTGEEDAGEEVETEKKAEKKEVAKEK